MATKSFLERNPIRLGVIGTLVLVGVLAVALNFDTIPGIGPKTYHAEFLDASGLVVGDTAQIAGVKVGKVREISSTETRSKSNSTQTAATRAWATTLVLPSRSKPHSGADTSN